MTDVTSSFQFVGNDFRFKPDNSSNRIIAEVRCKNTSKEGICFKFRANVHYGLYGVSPTEGKIQAGNELIVKIKTFIDVVRRVRDDKAKHNFRIHLGYEKDYLVHGNDYWNKLPGNENYKDLRVTWDVSDEMPLLSLFPQKTVTMTTTNSTVPQNITPPENNAIEVAADNILKDELFISIFTQQCEYNDPGDFDSTPNKFVTGSQYHQWQLKCYPAGDFENHKGHVSVSLYLSTTKQSPVTVEGMIMIVKPAVERKFKITFQTDAVLSFPKLIPHEDVRNIVEIENLTIYCTALFDSDDC